MGVDRLYNPPEDIRSQMSVVCVCGSFKRDWKLPIKPRMVKSKRKTCEGPVVK